MFFVCLIMSCYFNAAELEVELCLLMVCLHVWRSWGEDRARYCDHKTRTTINQDDPEFIPWTKNRPALITKGNSDETKIKIGDWWKGEGESSWKSSVSLEEFEEKWRLGWEVLPALIVWDRSSIYFLLSWETLTEAILVSCRPIFFLYPFHSFFLFLSEVCGLCTCTCVFFSICSLCCHSLDGDWKPEKTRTMIKCTSKNVRKKSLPWYTSNPV